MKRVRGRLWPVLRTAVSVAILVSACGGCPLSPSDNVPWSGATKMRGVWAVANAEGGGLFTLFSVNEEGEADEVCYQVDLAEYGVRAVAVGGSPHEVAPGLTTQVWLDLSETDGVFVMILRGDVRTGGTIVATAEGSIGGVVDEDGEGYGFRTGRLYKLGQEFVTYDELVIKRISDTPQSCLADDEFETNDDAEHAAPLAPGDYEHLRLLNADWYRVDAVPGNAVRVRVDYDHRLGDLDLRCYDVTGAALPIWPRWGLGYGQLILPEGENSYLVLVEPPPGGINPDYSLSVLPFSDDSYEENDSAETAFAGGAGVYDLVVFDDDWFRVTVDHPVAVEATLEFTHSNGDLELELRDASGVLLDQSISATNSEYVWGFAPGESYLVHVYGCCGATNTGRLTITLVE